MPRSDVLSWVGTTFTAKHWLSLDACGLLCISLSFGVHAYALLVVSWLLISSGDSKLNLLLYSLLYLPATLLALSSLYMAWTTNPGAVPMGAKPLTTFKRQGSAGSTDGIISPTAKRGIRRCHKCMDNFKPPRAHHDSVTGRCIVKMDHYCPWVCNAVGALNHKFFVQFIGYTLVSSLTALVLVVLKFVHCSSYTAASSDSGDDSSMPSKQDTEEEQTDNVAMRFLMDADTDGIRSECNAYDQHNSFVLILFIMSVIFSVFTFCMLLEQVDAVQSNTWKIARMKLKVNAKGSTDLQRVTQDFNELFGGNSPNVAWHWFLPLSVKFPKGMRKVVLGYDYDETFSDGTPYDEEKDTIATSVDTSTASPNTSQHSRGSLSAGIDNQNTEGSDDSFQDEPLDDVDEDDQSGPLVASPTDSAHLGTTTTKKKKGGVLLKRRKDDNPKFVNRTASLS